jgi:nitroreductase
MENTMDTIKAIITRRSVRHFTDEPVSEEQVNTLLRAAMQAPSAVNAQPWHFVVVNERPLLKAITSIHPYAECVHQAPLAVLVCADLALEKSPGYWVQDCSAATQNLLLAARALGLGAVWLGIYPIQERIEGLRRLLHLPERVQPLSLAAVGHPLGEYPPPENRFRPDRVHYNRW